MWLLWSNASTILIVATQDRLSQCSYHLTTWAVDLTRCIDNSTDTACKLSELQFVWLLLYICLHAWRWVPSVCTYQDKAGAVCVTDKPCFEWAHRVWCDQQQLHVQLTTRNFDTKFCWLRLSQLSRACCCIQNKFVHVCMRLCIVAPRCGPT